MVNTEIRLIIFFAAEDGEAYIFSKNKTRIYCSSDNELLIDTFRLKSKKVGKTTRHSGMTSIKSLMIIQWK